MELKKRVKTHISDYPLEKYYMLQLKNSLNLKTTSITTALHLHPAPSQSLQLLVSETRIDKKETIEHRTQNLRWAVKQAIMLVPNTLCTYHIIKS